MSRGVRRVTDYSPNIYQEAASHPPWREAASLLPCCVAILPSLGSSITLSTLSCPCGTGTCRAVRVGRSAEQPVEQRPERTEQ
jgi:hypothetical protein